MNIKKVFKQVFFSFFLVVISLGMFISRVCGMSLDKTLSRLSNDSKKNLIREVIYSDHCYDNLPQILRNKFSHDAYYMLRIVKELSNENAWCEFFQQHREGAGNTTNHDAFSPFADPLLTVSEYTDTETAAKQQEARFIFDISNPSVIMNVASGFAAVFHKLLYDVEQGVFSGKIELKDGQTVVIKKVGQYITPAIKEVIKSDDGYVDAFAVDFSADDKSAQPQNAQYDRMQIFLMKDALLKTPAMVQSLLKEYESSGSAVAINKLMMRQIQSILSMEKLTVSSAEKALLFSEKLQKSLKNQIEFKETLENIVTNTRNALKGVLLESFEKSKSSDDGKILFSAVRPLLITASAESNKKTEKAPKISATSKKEDKKNADGDAEVKTIVTADNGAENKDEIATTAAAAVTDEVKKETEQPKISVQKTLRQIRASMAVSKNPSEELGKSDNNTASSVTAPVMTVKAISDLEKTKMTTVSLPNDSEARAKDTDAKISAEKKTVITKPRKTPEEIAAQTAKLRLTLQNIRAQYAAKRVAAEKDTKSLVNIASASQKISAGEGTNAAKTSTEKITTQNKLTKLNGTPAKTPFVKAIENTTSTETKTTAKESAKIAAKPMAAAKKATASVATTAGVSTKAAERSHETSATTTTTVTKPATIAMTSVASVEASATTSARVVTAPAVSATSVDSTTSAAPTAAKQTAVTTSSAMKTAITAQKISVTAPRMAKTASVAAAQVASSLATAQASSAAAQSPSAKIAPKPTAGKQPVTTAAQASRASASASATPPSTGAIQLPPFTEYERKMGYVDTKRVMNCEIDGKRKRVQIVNVSHDGSCGFYSLGVTRDDAAKRLLDALQTSEKDEVIAQIAPEIEAKAISETLPDALAVEVKPMLDEKAKLEEKDMQNLAIEIKKFLNDNEEKIKAENLGEINALWKASRDERETILKPDGDPFPHDELIELIGKFTNKTDQMNQLFEIKAKIAALDDQIIAYCHKQETVEKYIKEFVRPNSWGFRTNNKELLKNNPRENNWLDINHRSGVGSALAYLMKSNLRVVSGRMGDPNYGKVMYSCNFRGARSTIILILNGCMYMRGVVIP